MPFDYKKEYKEFYLPPAKPNLVTLPPVNYIAMRGQGDPNVEDGEYKRSISMLYGIAFTLKMCRKAGYDMEGYFDYVVPPLEGLWWTADGSPLDFFNKSSLQFISMIRLPDFVRHEDFNWAVSEATQKKKSDFSAVEYFHYEEGLCVQCMHIGPYDNEPETISSMASFAESNGYQVDLTPTRLHHEIYLSDPRRTSPEKLKTVIRIPVK